MTLVSSWLTSRAPNERGVGKIRNFQPISRHISETVQDRTMVILMTNRKSYMRFRLVPKSMTLDDLWLLWVQIFTEFCASSHFWEATTAKRMKIDPYYQRQKCSPMTLVNGNIRRMRLVAGGSPWRRRQMTVELSLTAIFGHLGGYLLLLLKR